MPYVVITKRELPPGGLPHGEHPHDYGYPSVSRWAVATLDERCVFDAAEWGGKDVGDNSQFVHPALILRRYTPFHSHGMELATVLFLHNGRVSSGHFTHAMLTPDVPIIPEAGGTAGPLPDGTIIQVQRVSVERLCNMMPPEVVAANALAWSKSSDAIIEAFNAHEAA
jgi:hypothetical protein